MNQSSRAHSTGLWQVPLGMRVARAAISAADGDDTGPIGDTTRTRTGGSGSLPASSAPLPLPQPSALMRSFQRRFQLSLSSRSVRQRNYATSGTFWRIYGCFPAMGKTRRWRRQNRPSSHGQKRLRLSHARTFAASHGLSRCICARAMRKRFT